MLFSNSAGCLEPSLPIPACRKTAYPSPTPTAGSAGQRLVSGMGSTQPCGQYIRFDGTCVFRVSCVSLFWYYDNVRVFMMRVDIGTKMTRIT
jgi:hypothetical protein